MKKIYLLLIILVVGIRLAHAQDTTSLAGKLQFIFAQLNRNDISTGFLEERGFPLVSLTPFNGTLTDSNKVSIQSLRASYFTHYSSCMLTSNPMLPLDSINNRINQYLPYANPIPIAIHFGELNTFKSDAVSNNLLSVDADDVLHDVPGRLQNPYLLKYIFAASPIKSDFATGNFTLVFRPNLFFTNSSLTVSALYIDFDDGNGYQSASWNTPLTPNYSTAGTKNIKLKMVMSNSSQYECYAPVTVADIPALSRYAPNSIDHLQVFTATGSHSGGSAFVHYSSTNHTGHLKKPLIVAEGYDAAQVAPNLVSNGNYSYMDFIRAINSPSTTYDFNAQLDDIGGYDLVFIDYANGTDYIERNANLFKAVLNWVNADKALGGSTQQNVVMGISMGGLVARYALAQMTKNNETTDTRLLITHDSPHQGANVPVGLQEIALNIGRVNLMGYTINKVMPEYAEVKTLMAAPATQQLLTYRVEVHENQLFPYFNFINHYYSTIEQNTWLASVYRPMITFSPSDPQPSYKFIATSQGSECGTQLFSPGSRLLTVQGNASGILFPFLFAGGKASVNIEANALPNIGGSNQIAKIDIWVKKYFLGIRVDKDAFKYTKSISNSQLLPIDGASGGTSPIGPITLPPASAGGMQSLGSFFGLLYLGRLNTATLSSFAFVSTPSALDIQTYDVPSLSSAYVGGWNPSNPSRAVNFIAQEGSGTTFNENHTRFTARNAEWLFKEIEGISNTLNCSANCSPNIGNTAIVGLSYPCSSSTFSISNLPTGTTVTWSVTGTYNISGSNTANPVTVQRTSNGYGVLTANITTSCGSYTVTKNLSPLSLVVSPGGNGYCGEATVNVGIPSGNSFYWEVTGDLEINANGQTLTTTDNNIAITGTRGTIAVTTSACGSPITLYYDYQPYARPLSIAVSSIVGSEPLNVSILDLDYAYDNIYWYIDNDLVETGMGTLYYSNPPCGEHEVRAEVLLPCGATVVVGSSYFERYCGGWWRSMVIYPNPASSYLNIQPDAEKLKALSAEEKSAMKEYEALLYDINGKLLLKGRSSTYKLNLDTRHLKSDNYFIHIKIDGEKEIIKKQVIIRN